MAKLKCLVTGVGRGGKVMRGIVLVEATDWDPFFHEQRPCWRVSFRKPPYEAHSYPRHNCSPELAASMFVQEYVGLHPILGSAVIGEEEW